jgi:aryl-alcohol dehydrogenase-like predicted oxidoreductase
MQTRTLGRNGPAVSAVGLGCRGMSPGICGPADDVESVATVHAALEAGVTLIYGMGHNEMLIRDAIKERPRKDTVISVKFGALRDPANGWGGNDGRPQAVRTDIAPLIGARPCFQLTKHMDRSTFTATLVTLRASRPRCRKNASQGCDAIRPRWRISTAR